MSIHTLETSYDESRLGQVLFQVRFVIPSNSEKPVDVGGGDKLTLTLEEKLRENCKSCLETQASSQ